MNLKYCRFNSLLWVPFLGAVTATFVLSGCASVTIDPIGEKAALDISLSDRLKIDQHVEPVLAPLSLNAVLARALRHNLDFRVKFMQETLASDRLNTATYDMLPTLVAQAGYSWQDDESTRKSLNPITGEVSNVGFISAEKSFSHGDINLSWNLLDLGVSYYTAKQNADRVLIAREQRRKTMHTIMERASTVFWRALAHQELAEHITEVVSRAEGALKASQQSSKDRIGPVEKPLRYQRNLLENLRLLEEMLRELNRAKHELSSLMGLMPGTPYRLEVPEELLPPAMDASMESMEMQALAYNPDLRSQFYSARIAALETRSAILKLMPGLRLSLGTNYSGDSYLKHNVWAESSASISYNLINLLRLPSAKKSAQSAEDVEVMRRMALQMAIIAQVYLSAIDLDDSRKQFERVNDIYEVDTALQKIATNKRRSDVGGGLEQIAAEVSSILSTSKRYQSISRVHQSASRLNATLGLGLDLATVDDMSIESLESALNSLPETDLLVNPMNTVAEENFAQTDNQIQEGELPGTVEAATEAMTTEKTALMEQGSADSPVVDEPELQSALPVERQERKASPDINALEYLP